MAIYTINGTDYILVNSFIAELDGEETVSNISGNEPGQVVVVSARARGCVSHCDVEIQDEIVAHVAIYTPYVHHESNSVARLSGGLNFDNED